MISIRVAAELNDRPRPALDRSSPSRLVDAFDQVVEPLITEITCLRSQEPTLFHLVKAYVGSPPRGNYGLDKR